MTCALDFAVAVSQAAELAPPSPPSFAISAIGGSVTIDYIVIYGYGGD